MTPLDTLQTLLRINKPVAVFLFSGLAVLAAAAVALTWVGAKENLMFVAGYILALAFAVTLLTFVITNDKMRAVLGWMVTSLFLLFMIGLVDSALGASGRLPTPACYVRILWEHPRACEARLFPVEQVSSEPTPVRLASAGEARIWLAQAAGTPAPERRDPPYARNLIYLHFSDARRRPEMTDLARQLTGLGWPVTDAARGGELVKRTPDRAEVRYFDSDAEKDARALARAIKALKPDNPVYLRDFSDSGLVARAGILEIWLPS